MNGAALRYEVALSIVSGVIVWVARPYPCGRYPNLRIYPEKLKLRLRPWEKVIADHGFPDPCDLLHAYAANFDGYHRAVRARHETVNGRLKRFNVLTDVFCHRRELHSVFVYAVLHVTNLVMTFEEPLFALG